MINSSRMDTGSPQYNIVREHYLFSGLEEKHFNTLVEHMSTAQLRKGDVLFHRGDPANCFYFVEQGQVELSVNSPSGQKKVIEVVGQGRTFAEAIVFMTQNVFPVTAEALADCRLVRIPNGAYLDLLNGNPDACLLLLGDVCRHLHARVKEIERLTIQNARHRFSSYLIEHIVDSDGDTATIQLDLPRNVIASRLSVTPETLSRMLRQMVDEGIITIDDREITVHSLAKLRPYD